MDAKVKEAILADVQTLLEDVDFEIEQTGDYQTKERMEATRETVENLMKKIKEDNHANI